MTPSCHSERPARQTGRIDTTAEPHPIPAPSPWPARRWAIGAVLVGVAMVAVVYGALGVTLAAPHDHRPAEALVWAGIGLAAAGVGSALLAMSGVRRSWRDAVLPVAAGLVAALALTAATGWGVWRTIAGSPPNRAAAFYSAEHVLPIVDRLIEHAGDRPILGIYLSNHYECSVVVPLTGGPSGSRGGEIFSIYPDGSATTVQTSLSEGLATGDGVPVDSLDLAVIPEIAEQVAADQGVGPRDEIRIQLQTRNGETSYGVLTRIDGEDQPWVWFDADGNRL